MLLVEICAGNLIIPAFTENLQITKLKKKQDFCHLKDISKRQAMQQVFQYLVIVVTCYCAITALVEKLLKMPRGFNKI